MSYIYTGDNSNKNCKERKCRTLILHLCFILGNIYSLRANLSVAIVAMVAKKGENVTAEYQVNSSCGLP